MDFFSFSADLSTPIGQAIERATNELLIGPDWAQNLEICDMINSTPDGPDQAVRALKRRMKSEKPKVVQLTLTITETCVKNCGVNFHAHIAKKSFMDEMVALATVGKRGFEVQEQSLKLIQQWGIAFRRQSHTLPVFVDTYEQLKFRGVRFPPIDENDVPVFDPPVSVTPSSAQSAAREPEPTSTNEDEFKKLESDLDVVMEKVNLCREMLPESPGIRQDEALAEVIGFLEACRDRMVQLIEAGAQGILGEEILAKCFQVNDALLKTLEAEKTGSVLPLTDEQTPASGAVVSNLIDLGSPQQNTQNSSTLQATVDDDDEFASLSLRTSRRVGTKNRLAPSGPPSTGGMKPVAAPSAATTPFEDLIGSSAGTQPVAAPASSASFAPAATLAAPTPFARPQSGSFTLDAISPSTITPTPYNSIQTPVASSLPNLASTPGFGSATGFTNPALLTPFASMQPRVESGATTTDIDMLLREPVPATSAAFPAPVPAAALIQPTGQTMSDEEFEKFLSSVAGK